jgi:hypothetical protein
MRRNKRLALLKRFLRNTTTSAEARANFTQLSRLCDLLAIDEARPKVLND